MGNLNLGRLLYNIKYIEMMKRNIIIVFFFLTNFLYSQNFEIQWQQCYGGSDIDRAYDLLGINENYLIIGTTQSTDGDITFNNGATDGWLIKTNHSGDIIWEKSYGGSFGDGFDNIISSSQGDFFLIGGSNSSDGDVSFDPYPDTQDFWIVKIDSLGDIIWDRIVGGNGHDQIWTGIPTLDGGVVALGWTNSDDGDVSQHYGSYDMWLVKLNSQGEIKWDFTIGNNYMDFGQAIIETSDAGFLVGGTSKITEGGNLTCESHGQADAILVKLDSLRNIEWQHCYGGSDNDGVYGILELDDGYVFSAFTHSNDGDVTGFHGNTDIWIVKIDFEGTIIWEHSFGGSNGEVAFNLFRTIDEDIIVIGKTFSNDGDVSGNHSLSEYDNDIWMLKVNKDGILLWQKCFGGEGSEATSGLSFGAIQKSDYNYVIAGQTDYGPSDDVQCDPHGTMWSDFWVFEIKDTTVGISQTPQNETLKVYPNPANNYVVFETENPANVIAREARPRQSHTITITNTYGQQITTLQVKDNKTVWDTRSINSGVYFYSLMIAGEFKSGKVIIGK
jgi:hypothetical protein